jgi:phage terminase small subunit
METPENSKRQFKGLTEKQKVFCRNYIHDWNATRSYVIAYPGVKNDNVAHVNASRLLQKATIQQYIIEVQKDLEKLSGISKKMVLDEHKKLAFSSIAHLHNTWIERKQFESLTDEQKACISEISTQTRTVHDVDIEFIKIKLYDKQKALDSISKMLGYDAPGKIDLTSGGQKIGVTITVTDEQTKTEINKLINGNN